MPQVAVTQERLKESVKGREFCPPPHPPNKKKAKNKIKAVSYVRD